MTLFWFLSVSKLKEDRALEKEDDRLYIEYLKCQIIQRDSLLKLHYNHINRLKMAVGMPIDSTFNYKNKCIFTLK